MLCGGALASCASSPEPDARAEVRQQQLQHLLAGKVPGKPISCLPSYNANDMETIDGRTVAFTIGMRTAYLMHLTPGCGLLGTGNYALLTKQYGGMGLCRGDIAQVFDTVSRTMAGSCGIAEIVPYTTPGRGR